MNDTDMVLDIAKVINNGNEYLENSEYEKLEIREQLIDSLFRLLQSVNCYNGYDELPGYPLDDTRIQFKLPEKIEHTEVMH